jgi:recombination protein RecT
MNDKLSINQKAKMAISKAKRPGTLAGLSTASVSDVLNAYRSAISQAIPKHLTVDRIIQQATTLITQNPEIAKCTAPSLIGATMQASILGFQPVQALGHCYFVPFKDQVQFIIGYKGYIDLARRSGEIKSIMAYCVYSADEFTYELGLEPVLKHIPASGDRGDLTHAYAVAHFTNGGYAFEVVDKFHVMKRKAASQSKNSNYSPWQKWEAEMWVKTAIKALSKWLPLSVDIAGAIQTDEKILKPDNFDDGELNIDEIETPDYEVMDNEPEPQETAEDAPEPKQTRMSKGKATEALLGVAMGAWNIDDMETVEKLLDVLAVRKFDTDVAGMQVVQLKKMIDQFADGDYPTPF